jgi:hypothetical protein
MNLRSLLAFFSATLVVTVTLVPGRAIGNTNSNAKIAGHLQTILGGKSPPPVCEQAQLEPCNACDSTLAVHGSVGVGYRLYLLVLDGDPDAGIAGAAFGISYGSR